MVLRRIKAYLDEVCELEDPRSRGKGLSADLAGYWRYRIGDYRVLVGDPRQCPCDRRDRSRTPFPKHLRLNSTSQRPAVPTRRPHPSRIEQEGDPLQSRSREEANRRNSAQSGLETDREGANLYGFKLPVTARTSGSPGGGLLVRGEVRKN